MTITVTCSGYIPWLYELQLRWPNLVKTTMVFCSGAHFITNVWEQCKLLNTGKSNQKLSCCIASTQSHFWTNALQLRYKNQLWQSVNRLVEDLEYDTTLGGHPIAKWSVTLTQSTSWSTQGVCMFACLRQYSSAGNVASVDGGTCNTFISLR